MSIVKLALIAGVAAVVVILSGTVVLAETGYVSFGKGRATVGPAPARFTQGYNNQSAPGPGNGNGYYGPMGPAGGGYGPGMMGGYGYGAGMMGSGSYGAGGALWDQMWSAMRSGNWNGMYQACLGIFNGSNYPPGS